MSIADDLKASIIAGRKPTFAERYEAAMRAEIQQQRDAIERHFEHDRAIVGGDRRRESELYRLAVKAAGR